MLFGDPPHLRKWLEMGTLQEGSWSPHILLFLPLWSLAAQAWPCGLLSMNVMWQSVGMTFLTLGYTKTLVRCLARLLLLAQSAMAGATSWRQETKGCGQQSGRNRGPQPHNSCGTESSKKKKTHANALRSWSSFCWACGWASNPVTLWMTSRKKHPDELLSDSWPTENCCCFKLQIWQG